MVTRFNGDSFKAAAFGSGEAVVLGKWFIQHGEIGIEDIERAQVFSK